MPWKVCLVSFTVLIKRNPCQYRCLNCHVNNTNANVAIIFCLGFSEALKQKFGLLEYVLTLIINYLYLNEHANCAGEFAPFFECYVQILN